MRLQPSFVHDMSNTLGIVLAYANLLLDQLPPDDSRRADVEEIRKAGEGALRLLERWAAEQVREEP